MPAVAVAVAAERARRSRKSAVAGAPSSQRFAQLDGGATRRAGAWGSDSTSLAGLPAARAAT